MRRFLSFLLTAVMLAAFVLIPGTIAGVTQNRTGNSVRNYSLNGDGKLLAGEARKILRYSAKLETEL